MNLIGNNIKIIRKQIGLTQEELALHIGVTPQAVSRWENGTGMLNIIKVYFLMRQKRPSLTIDKLVIWRLIHKNL